jgi:hypothetical protein
LMNIDPRVVNGVLDELWDLVRWERNEESALADTVALAPSVARHEAIASIEAEPAPDAGGGRPAIRLPIAGDVTCTQCWGFEKSAAGAQGLESWMR